MTFHGLLIHKCTIQRDETPDRDSYGAEVMVWSDLHTNLKCRLITSSERLASASFSGQVVTVYQLLLPANTDVTTKDIVLSVTLEDGSSEGPFDITAVVPRRDGHRQRLVALNLDHMD